MGRLPSNILAKVSDFTNQDANREGVLRRDIAISILIRTRYASDTILDAILLPYLHNRLLYILPLTTQVNLPYLAETCTR